MKNSPALTSIRSTMIFLLVLMAILIGLSSVFEPATARLRAAAPVGTINSNYALLSEVFVSIAVFISLLIMRRIDKTPLAERNFGKRPRYGEVALGLSAGLSTLAFVLLIQLALGVLKISPSAEAASLQIHNCVIWAQCFLITGLCEEAVFRGYLLGTLQIASENSLFAEAGYQKALCPDYAVVDLKRGGLGAWSDFENSEGELYQENECERRQSSGQAERDFAVTRPLSKIPFGKRRFVDSAHDEQRDEHRDGDEYFAQERVV